MPRKYKSPERFLKGDPKFGSKLVSKFINNMMMDGKKSTAQRIFYGALEEVTRRVSDVEAFEVFRQALDNVKPRMEVRSRRVGGANYQVPKEVSARRQTALATRWLLAAVREKKGRPTHLKLADELIKAYNKEGAAINKKITTHKMAEANKAFAHFAW